MRAGSASGALIHNTLRYRGERYPAPATLPTAAQGADLGWALDRSVRMERDCDVWDKGVGVCWWTHGCNGACVRTLAGSWVRHWVGALVEKNRGIGGGLREWEWKIDCVWVEG